MPIEPTRLGAPGPVEPGRTQAPRAAARGSAADRQPAAGAPRDTVSVSAEARRLAALDAATAGASAERQQQIARLKMQVASGDYAADADAVAEALLRGDQP